MGRRHASRWLLGVSESDGLLIPGRPSAHAADLRLGEDRVEVIAGGIAASVEWADFTSGYRSNERTADWWSIGPWTYGRGGPIGVGMQVAGRCAASTEPVRRARKSWRNRLNRFLQDGTVVPLCGAGHISWAVEADCAVVAVLCTVLADEPELRSRLHEPARIARLAGDLADQPHAPVPFRMGARRVTTEVLTALHLLGFEHRYGGRPLPGTMLPPADELVDRVLDRVAANPYAKDVKLDAAQARQVIEHFYLDVDPWPIGALTD